MNCILSFAHPAEGAACAPRPLRPGVQHELLPQAAPAHGEAQEAPLERPLHIRVVPPGSHCPLRTAAIEALRRR
eukprot:984189-Pyramimonas_sp.AAC.1